MKLISSNLRYKESVMATTTTSITIDRKKAGIVTLVGNAARLVTNARPIADNDTITSAKLLLVTITAIAVKGVSREA